MRNIIVCFPGGAGGHFVASVVNYLIHGKEFSIDQNGSMHSSTVMRYLDGYLLDDSMESIVQELVDIGRLPNFDLAVSHFRNIPALLKQNKKVVYIDIDANDIPEVARRLRMKMSQLINVDTYNILKGTEWPDYESYTHDTVPEDVNNFRIQFLKNWFYVVPVNKDNVFKINFNEMCSEKWVIELAKFLDIHTYNTEFIKTILKAYQEKQ